MSGSLKVKICGMTRAQDAVQAVELDVDAIGMILHANSPRLITIEQAQKIRAVVPEGVRLVGVFVDATFEYIQQCVTEIGLDIVQLHGDESVQFCQLLGLPYIKAIRAKTAEQVSHQVSLYSLACAVLLDPYVKGQHGGTGKQLDFDLWPTKSGDQKQILAGGLSPSNVAEAVAVCQPYAVDLNSGVESAPGIKDVNLIRQALSELKRL